MYVDTTCSFCGGSCKSKKYKVIKNFNVFCSNQCKSFNQWKRKVVTCKFCNKLSFKMIRNLSQENFCDVYCRRKWNIKTSSSIKPYGNRNSRRYRLEIFGNACVICGFSRRVEFAHIIPASEGGTMHEDNILVLCVNHHRLFDNNLLFPEEYQIIHNKIAKARTNHREAV